MLKRSIGIGMLCVAGHAYSADIIVNTTEDLTKDDKECSLREAIEYVNRGMPKEGYNGCGGENSTSSILLEKKANYKITSKLPIKAELTIKTTYETNVNEDAIPGLNNATIQMTGKDQIFYIDDADAEKRFTVNLKEVNLAGCTDQNCAQNGGLIYNNESLYLDYVKLSGGYAEQGGAIYNVAINTAHPAFASYIEISNSLIVNNHADEGGIIYSQKPGFKIMNTVFSGNETRSNTSANIYSAQQLEDAEIAAFPFVKYTISNSTFFKNIGTVANVIDGMGLNNLTIVANTAGLIFNASREKAYLSNSILLGNPYPVTGVRSDCRFNNDHSFLLNNVVSQDCGSGAANYQNEFWTGTQLFAGNDIKGNCLSLKEDDQSSLCPYKQSENSFLGYFRPRILLSYSSLANSLIVNKGRARVTSSDVYIGCEGSDQRGKSRDVEAENCDRGAIEIVVPATIGLVGKDLLIGQVAKISIADMLGDSDPIPKEECDKIYPENQTGEPWKDGCLMIVQTQTPSKGKLTIDLDGNLVYTPNGAWRGADIFTIRVVTSSTRFNKSKPYMEVNVQIVQEAENKMEDKSVKTSGGSFGIFSVIAVLGLFGLRRFKK
ncbi:rhombotarget A [Acinetobacter sp.]|uniref:rhombotarget A n=1 Tax=Acinetobacter sp. TaxID=472 RepID=UPI0026489DB2|nr:rhombotarget A [Acinetobacter sp.]MDN5511428.1 rhombotarget A [Acinetobacter sp.]MDN5524681.1 rhombotarget A [Acinetobacter sp.]